MPYGIKCNAYKYNCNTLKFVYMIMNIFLYNNELKKILLMYEEKFRLTLKF